MGTVPTFPDIQGPGWACFATAGLIAGRRIAYDSLLSGHPAARAFFTVGVFRSTDQRIWLNGLPEAFAVFESCNSAIFIIASLFP